MSEVSTMGLIEREDKRRWRVTGDPPTVESGPAVFPGTVVRVVPEDVVVRLESQLAGAVDTLERIEYALRAGTYTALGAAEAHRIAERWLTTHRGQ